MPDDRRRREERTAIGIGAGMVIGAAVAGAGYRRDDPDAEGGD